LIDFLGSEFYIPSRIFSCKFPALYKVNHLEVSDTNQDTSMAHLFEVKALRSVEATATKWKIVSNDYIDTDLYKVINQKIKSFDLVATAIEEEGVMIYELSFYRSYEAVYVRRMFPGCIVEAIRQIRPSRIYVTYCRETNSYIPFDDASM